MYTDANMLMESRAAPVDIMDMETQLLDVLPHPASTTVDTLRYAPSAKSDACPSREPPFSVGNPVAMAAQITVTEHAEEDSQETAASGQDLQELTSSGNSQHMLSARSSLRDDSAQLAQPRVTEAAATPELSVGKQLAGADISQDRTTLAAAAVSAPALAPLPSKAAVNMNSLLEAMLAGDV